MRLLKFVGVLVVLAGVGLYAQARQSFGTVPDPSFMVLAGRGAEIGVSIRDVTSDDKAAGGVIVEEVRPDSAAEKARLKPSDLIVEFDGEHVRSARQFTRLVQETAPGRTVKATVMRGGQRKDLQITPDENRSSDVLRRDGDRMMLDGQRLQDRLNELGRLKDRSLPFNFNGGDFKFTMPFDGRGRLGLAVDELTPQLATYFGAKDGVLVVSVSDDSPASRAGLKAGDIVTKIDNEPVRSREDLTRLVGDVKDDGEVTIGIVRDRKETTLKAKLEARRPRRGQPA